jgi:membrane protease YdiL (CAAX protease family)
MNNLVKVLWNNEQKRLRVIWRIGLYGLMIFLFSALLSTVIILIAGAGFALSSPRNGTDFPTAFVYERVLALINNESLMLMISSTTTLVSILGITPFSMKVIDRRKWTPVKQQIDRSWWKDLGMGCVVGFSSIGLIFTVLVAFGNIRVTGFNTDFWGLDFLISFFGWLLIFICVGVYEEIVFRGYVFKNLSEGFFGKWLTKENAVIVSGIVTSLAFSILHLTNPYTNFLSFINFLVIGCLLCISVLVTRRLAFAIGFHIFWNFSQGVLFGIPVSGLAPQAHLLDVKLNGAAWFTGSLFGFEGSVLCLITNITITILIFLFYIMKNKDLRLNYKITEYTPAKPSISDPQSMP